MKSLLLITITLLTWSASANTIIAKYDFGVQSQTNTDNKFVKATLTDEGDLSIEVYDSLFVVKAGSIARPAANEMIFTQISEKNLIKLSNLARETVNSEIVNVFPQIICMMMPAEYMTSNHLYLNREFNNDLEKFVGHLELVLGPQGCWSTNRTHLADSWANDSAKEIKTILKILVNEHAGHLL